MLPPQRIPGYGERAYAIAFARNRTAPDEHGVGAAVKNVGYAFDACNVHRPKPNQPGVASVPDIGETRAACFQTDRIPRPNDSLDRKRIGVEKRNLHSHPVFRFVSPRAGFLAALCDDLLSVGRYRYPEKFFG